MDSSKWLKDLAEDQNLWNENVITKAPSVVAHEYHRLREMSKHEQVFGFILQLKDVMESILKFQVLLMAAFGETKEGAEEAYAFHFAERALSMGAWLALGSEINTFCGKHNDYPEALQNSWDFVLNAFSGQHWVAWRNTIIAHGALAFDADQYKQDITDKLGELKDLLDEMMSYYLQMKVMDEHGEYMGYLRARKLEQENGEMLCRIGEETELPLRNYILHRNHGIYFFDAITSGSMANCLSYPEGDHWQEAIAYWSQVNQLYKDGQLSGATSLSTEDITNVLNEAVNRISLSGVHRFIRPEYLVNWLKQALYQNKRGVFLLTMDRGCGKSTFTEKLNRLYAKPLELAIESNDAKKDNTETNKTAKKDVIDVRTYHISRTQTMKASQFTSAVSNLWRKAYQDPNEKYKAVEFEEQALMFMPKEDEVPAEAFAKYLNNIRKKTQVHRLKKRILFVLDGLDEIIPDAEKIWDYIPAPGLLDEGVYILLTGRNVEEQGLPVGYRQRIEQLQINASLSVSAQAQVNKQFLREYIKKQLSAGKCKYTDATANKIIELSGGRVLYARMHVQLLASGKYHAEELADAENIIPAYLEQLKQRYGEKGWKQMVALLTVFATMYDVDSLTLEEISWLLGENQPTLQLLGMISDISCMLNVERGYTVGGVTYAGENQYRLSDAQESVALLDYLRKYEEIAIYALTGGLMQRTLQLLKKETDSHDSGYLLMLSCIVDFGNRFCRGNVTLSEKQLSLITKTVLKIQDKGFHWKTSNRIMRSYSQTIQGYLNRQTFGAAAIDELVNAYYARGNLLFQMQRREDALADYNRSVEICEWLQRVGRLADESALAALYNSRGALLFTMQRWEDALADQNRNVEICERLQQAGRLADEYDLVCACNNRGNLLFQMQRWEDALADYNRSIEICEWLQRAGRIVDEIALAAVYIMRGNLLFQMQRWEEALDDYNRDVEICKRLQQAGRLVDENALVAAYIERGKLLFQMERQEEALDDYNRSVEICEWLQQAGRLADENALATAYNSRGSLLQSLGRTEDAEADFKRSDCILSRIKQEDKQ